MSSGLLQSHQVIEDIICSADGGSLEIHPKKTTRNKYDIYIQGNIFSTKYNDEIIDPRTITLKNNISESFCIIYVQQSDDFSIDGYFKVTRGPTMRDIKSHKGDITPTKYQPIYIHNVEFYKSGGRDYSIFIHFTNKIKWDGEAVILYDGKTYIARENEAVIDFISENDDIQVRLKSWPNIDISYHLSPDKYDPKGVRMKHEILTLPKSSRENVQKTNKNAINDNMLKSKRINAYNNPEDIDGLKKKINEKENEIRRLKTKLSEYEDDIRNREQERRKSIKLYESEKEESDRNIKELFRKELSELKNETIYLKDIQKELEGKLTESNKLNAEITQKINELMADKNIEEIIKELKEINIPVGWTQKLQSRMQYVRSLKVISDNDYAEIADNYSKSEKMFIGIYLWWTENKGNDKIVGKIESWNQNINENYVNIFLQTTLIEYQEQLKEVIIRSNNEEEYKSNLRDLIKMTILSQKFKQECSNSLNKVKILLKQKDFQLEESSFIEVIKYSNLLISLLKYCQDDKNIHSGK